MAENEWEQKGIRFATNGKRRNTFTETEIGFANKIPVLPL
jgi:hypothetical protein